MSPAASRTLGLVLLAAVSTAWGVNWPALKVVVSEVPLWQFRAVTGLAGSLVLFVLALLLRQSLVIPRREWPVLLVASLFNITSWFMLMAWGLSMLPATHASILAFTMPIFAAMFGVFFFGERLTVARSGAVLLVAGVVVVIMSHDFDALEASQLGVLVTLIGAANWAIGTLVQKHAGWTSAPVTVAAWQVGLGSLPIAVFALFQEDFVYHEASAEALWSSVYIVVVAIAFCFTGWFTVVRLLPTSIASIGTLNTPVVAAVSAALILGDPFGWREIAALAMVVTALTLVIYFDPAPAPEAAAEAESA
jgi:drug/metabolite transporter (DMT)-like permease